MRNPRTPRVSGCLLTRSVLAAVLAAAMAGAPARGQLPQTVLREVFPPGGKAGTSIDLSVTAAGTADIDRLVFSNSRITAQVNQAKPDEFADETEGLFGRFKVQIGNDVPPGIYEVRAIGVHGLSNPRAFVVSDRRELVAPSNHHSPAQAFSIGVGDVLSGRTAPSAIDFYKIDLKAGQRVVFHIAALQIDSRLNPVLSVHDAEGLQLSHAFAVERDPILSFQAPHDGTYQLRVHDEIYGGGTEYYYRLTADNRPFVVASRPVAATPGESPQIELLGWNLPQAKPSQIAFQGVPLARLIWEPPVPTGDGGYFRPVVPQFPDLIVGSLPARSVELPGKTRGQLALSTTPVTRESPSDTVREKSQAISIPCDVNGVFFPEGDEDWYSFSAKKGTQYWIEIVSHRLGSDADPYFLIQRRATDSSGTINYVDITQVDDPASRNAAIRTAYATASDDPSLLWTAPEDGEYVIMVRDQFGSGRRDPRAVYRLIIRPPRPSCRVIAVPQQLKTANANTIPTAPLSLRRGGSAAIRLLIDRREGFAGTIEVSIPELPTGVTAAPVTIGPTDATAWLVLQATRDAPAFLGPLKLVASAGTGSQQVPCTLIPGCVVSPTANRQIEPARLRPTTSLLLQVRDDDSVPVSLSVKETRLTTSLGGELKITVTADRVAGFDEAITVLPQGLPRELTLANGTIPKGKNEVTLTLTVKNARAKPGVYSLILRGDTKQKRTLVPGLVQRATQTQQRLAAAVKDTTAKIAAAKNQQVAATEKVKQIDQALKQAQAQLKQEADQAKQPPLRQQIAELTQALAEANTKKAAADKQLSEFEALRKRAEQLKKNADTALAAAKKQAAPKDVPFTALSPTLTLVLDESPVSLAGGDTLAIKAGESAQYAFDVTRKYGFDEPLAIKAVLPSGLGGVSIPAVSLPKGTAKSAAKITTSADTKPGSYPITLEAAGRFRGVAVKSTVRFRLTITAATPEAAK